MKLACIFIVVTMFCLACNKDTSNKKDSYTTAPATTTYESIQANPSDSKAISNKEIILQGSSPQPAIDWNKKIVKTANIKIEVKDLNRYSSTIYNAVMQAGGYISKEEQHNTEGMLAMNIDIKVPVANFESLLLSVCTKDSKILERIINTDDVTGQLVDTKARLIAKEQMRLRYLDFFKNAKDMNEVLQVQSEINRLQEEIEAASTSISYLSNASAMSTIHLYSVQNILPGDHTAPAEPGFFKRILAAIRIGGMFLAELFIGLLSIWPLWIAIGICLMIYKKRKRINGPYPAFAANDPVDIK